MELAGNDGAENMARLLISNDAGKITLHLVRYQFCRANYQENVLLVENVFVLSKRLKKTPMQS